jgi:hypothetical protein
MEVDESSEGDAAARGFKAGGKEVGGGGYTYSELMALTSTEEVRDCLKEYSSKGGTLRTFCSNEQIQNLLNKYGDAKYTSFSKQCKYLLLLQMFVDGNVKRPVLSACTWAPSPLLFNNPSFLRSLFQHNNNDRARHTAA